MRKKYKWTWAEPIMILSFGWISYTVSDWTIILAAFGCGLGGLLIGIEQ